MDRRTARFGPPSPKASARPTPRAEIPSRSGVRLLFQQTPAIRREVELQRDFGGDLLVLPDDIGRNLQGSDHRVKKFVLIIAVGAETAILQRLLHPVPIGVDILRVELIGDDGDLGRIGGEGLEAFKGLGFLGFVVVTYRRSPFGAVMPKRTSRRKRQALASRRASAFCRSITRGRSMVASW